MYIGTKIRGFLLNSNINLEINHLPKGSENYDNFDNMNMKLFLDPFCHHICD